MKRQAVVVIHGIGEQKPMGTLRGFVDSISDYTSEKQWIRVYNIPDSISQSYELRQLALYYGKDLRSDFFEYYWAHNLRGTKLVSVCMWLLQLMWRTPSNIPGRIRWLYILLWIIAAIYVAAIVSGIATNVNSAGWTQLPLIILAGNVLVNAITVIFTMYLGDAARYTYPAPDNIEERNKIRKAGIELLDRLHKSGKYSRIIVVGHSLGSMIGYDILKHLWAQYYKSYKVSADSQHEVLDKYNMLSAAGFDLTTPAGFRDYQNLQADLFAEQKRRGNPWLISDFVTLGSPLGYGPLLMADSADDFQERRKERELPSSPPVKETDGGVSYSQPFPSVENPNENVNTETIHHSGHFAFTRWHNLYYKMDFVGGPLRHVFGEGINDQVVRSKSWKSKVPFLMHTFYWGEPKKLKSVMKESIEFLKLVILK